LHKFPFLILLEASLYQVNALTHSLYRFMYIQPADGLGLFSPNATQRAEILFADVQLHVWCISSISVLWCAALHEDETGLAQNYLGDIFSAFLAYCLAIEEYVRSDGFLSASSSIRLQSHPLIRPQLISLLNAIDAARYRLVTTFHPHLHSLTLPPVYAHRLQTYAEFVR